MKKVDPAQGIQHYSSLLLDHNELARLENVETYSSLIKVCFRFFNLWNPSFNFYISFSSLLLTTS